MKKILLLLVVLSAVAFNSFAQSSKDDGGKFSIGLEAGIPVNYTDFYTFILGGSLKYEAPLSNGLAVTGTAGYTSLMIKSEFKGHGYPSSYGDIPIKAGLKYYFDPAFYAEGQLGVAISTRSGGGTSFVYSPGVGYFFASNVDLGLRYEGWSKSAGTLGILAVRLAYTFN
jgi:hypothetical protein